MNTQLSRWLLYASFTGTFAETLLAPFYVGLTNRFGGNILDAGIGFAIFSIFTGIFVTFVGQTKWFEDNTNSMVFWGFTVAGICDISYILCGNIIEFFLIQIICGISVGMLNPAWDALYSDDAEEGQHGKRWSFWTGGINFVTGLAALTGAIIVTYIGFRWLFAIMAVFDAWAVYFAYRVWKIADTEHPSCSHTWDHLPLHAHGKHRRVCTTCRLEEWFVHGKWVEPEKSKYSPYPECKNV